MIEHTSRTPLPWKPSTVIHLALKEDVEFAVRACNSYGDLLGALEGILLHNPAIRRPDRVTAEQAIAKARSEMDRKAT